MIELLTLYIGVALVSAEFTSCEPMRRLYCSFPPHARAHVMCSRHGPEGKPGRLDIIPLGLVEVLEWGGVQITPEAHTWYYDACAPELLK